MNEEKKGRVLDFSGTKDEDPVRDTGTKKRDDGQPDIFEVLKNASRKIRSPRELKRSYDCMMDIALQYCFSKEYDLALKQFEVVKELAEAMESPEDELRALLAIGQILRETGKLEKALETVEKGLRIARSEGLNDEAAKGLVCMASIAAARSDYGRALGYLDEAVTGAGETEDDLLLFLVHQEYGNIYSKMENKEKALRSYETCLDIAERIPSPVMAVQAHRSMVEIYVGEDEGEKALEHHRKILALAEKSGIPFLKLEALCDISLCCFYMCKLDLAKNYTLRYLSCANEQDAGEHITLARRRLSLIHRLESDPQGAIEHLEEAVRVFEKNGDYGMAADSRMHIADIYEHEGDLDGAVAVIEEAIKSGAGSEDVDPGLLKKSLRRLKDKRASKNREGFTSK